MLGLCDELLHPLPNLQACGPPCQPSAIACSVYLWQPFMTLHPQTEDMPCCGDRIPLTVVIECVMHIKALSCPGVVSLVLLPRATWPMRYLLCNEMDQTNRDLFKSKLLTKNSKLQMYKTFVRPVVTYACETWVLKENIKTKLWVFERKVLRRIYGPTKERDGTWRIKSN